MAEVPPRRWQVDPDCGGLGWSAPDVWETEPDPPETLWGPHGEVLRLIYPPRHPFGFQPSNLKESQ